MFFSCLGLRQRKFCSAIVSHLLVFLWAFPAAADTGVRTHNDRGQFIANEFLIKARSVEAVRTLSLEFSLSFNAQPILQTADGQWYKVTDEGASANFDELRAFIYSNHFLSENVLNVERQLLWHSLNSVADPKPEVPPRLPRRKRTDPLMNKVYGVQKIQSLAAWTKSAGSENVIVADIDTGIDYNHPDLINNMWRNVKEIADDGRDNDGNGYTDDVLGWDFTNKESLPWDDNGHGTHTSGSIAATGGNGIGISGVAQRASLMALKFLDGEGSGTTEDAILAIRYAINNGASILSNSWGGDEYSKALEDAISEAAARNVLFVAAAGNDGTNNDTLPMYPAAYNLPNVIAVAASDSQDKLADFSNYGVNSVHLAAPGDYIYSTLPEGKYGVNSGTSMACPHVAGAAALLKAYRPGLSAIDIKRILLQSVDKVPDYADKIASGGRLNVDRALSIVAAETTPEAH
ncbi:MAG: hypothetical protein RL189_2242 [Pseudomonadota bacterium]|jgi:subtilisin family serine protease